MTHRRDSKDDIRNRSDVALLVKRFYAKVSRDPELGPIFNQIVSDWEQHLDRLTDFWESQLFLKRNYVGKT